MNLKIKQFNFMGPLEGSTPKLKIHLLMEERKEGNVLFNDALNTFYFTVRWRRTYGKGLLI